MKSIIFHILDWTEVWALFIPLFVLVFRSPVNKPRTIVVYLWASLVINLIIDIISDYKKQLHLPFWLMSNNYFYSINSLLRLVCFTIFFIHINPKGLQRVNRLLFILFVFFFIINFCFYQNFFDLKIINTRLLAAETIVLLIFSILYFIYQVSNDVLNYTETGAFYIITGLSIFIVVSLPIYLFYKQLLAQDKIFGIDIWQVHNIAFLIFCIFIALGLTKKEFK